MTATGKIDVGRDVLRPAGAAVTLAIGGLWLVMNLFGGPARDVFLGAALTAGSLLLIAWPRLRLPAKPVSAGALAGGLAGTAAGLSSYSSQLCCMFSWGDGRGWPIAWVGRGAEADEADEARRQAVAAGWEVDYLSLLENVVVWTYASLVLIVGVSLLWRAWRARRKDPERVA